MAKNHNTRKPKQVKSPGADEPLKREYWICPSGLGHSRCGNREEHDKHATPLKLLADPSIVGFELRRIILSVGFGNWRSALEVLLSRDDWRDYEKQVVETALFEDSRPSHQWGTLHNPIGKKPRLTALELVLSQEDLSAKALKQLVNLPFSGTAELTLLFREQSRVSPYLIISYIANVQGVDDKDLSDALADISDEVKMALALRKLPSFRTGEPEKLRKASRVVLNQLNKDREVGLEMTNGLASDWQMDAEELAQTVKNLL